ncbi:MAG: hypothetical protein HC804_00105 [Anaerolineae bacterium]|nr:hypothetical protein [Anaerolineae bacterium]
MWLKASNKKGLTVPWVYIRRRVAEQWHCKPWEVDDAPMDEVMTELRILELEAEAAKRG